MSYRTPRQRTAQKELEDACAWVVAHLCDAVGPALTAQAAQPAVEQAKGWGPLPVREIARYLDQTPDGLTVPVVTGPLSVVRLRNVLHTDGHREAVTKATCVRCGRTDPLPAKHSPEGRCCGWCYAQMNFRPCGRCGRVDQIVTRRQDGPICRHCYSTDPLVVTECARCHRMRRPGYRCEDGTALCCNCRQGPRGSASAAAGYARSTPGPQRARSAAPATRGRNASAACAARPNRLRYVPPTGSRRSASAATAARRASAASAAGGVTVGRSVSGAEPSTAVPAGRGRSVLAGCAATTGAPRPSGLLGLSARAATRPGVRRRRPAPHVAIGAS